MINLKLLLWICLSLTGLAKISLAPAAYATLGPGVSSATEEHSIKPFISLADSPVAQALNVIEITNIQLEPTETGINIVLETSTGEPLLLPAPTTDGNNLVIDIPRAQLSLPDGDTFEGDNLAAGIAIVSVSQLGTERVRILVAGTETAPMGEVGLEGDQAVLKVSAAVADLGDDRLRIVVTAEKTPEDPLDVPISLTVLTEAELVDAQINSIAAVAANTPNFYFTPGDRVFNFIACAVSATAVMLSCGMLSASTLMMSPTTTSTSFSPARYLILSA